MLAVKPCGGRWVETSHNSVERSGAINGGNQRQDHPSRTADFPAELQTSGYDSRAGEGRLETRSPKRDSGRGHL